MGRCLLRGSVTITALCCAVLCGVVLYHVVSCSAVSYSIKGKCPLRSIRVKSHLVCRVSSGTWRKGDRQGKRQPPLRLETRTVSTCEEPCRLGFTSSSYRHRTVKGSLEVLSRVDLQMVTLTGKQVGSQSLPARAISRCYLTTLHNILCGGTD